MKKAYKLISLIFAFASFIVAAFMLFGNHSAKGSFLDLTNLAKASEGALSLILMTFSFIFWKTDNKKKKAFIFIILFLLIIFLTWVSLL